MTEAIISLLTGLSEAGAGAILSGGAAQPYYGPVFDRLLVKRVLIEQAPLQEWDVCSTCECGLISRPIRSDGDRFRAACPFNAREDVVLDENDLREFRIGVFALARAIAIAAGFEEIPSELTRGIWQLESTQSRRAIFLVFDPAVLRHDGVIPIIRQAARAEPMTLLAPQLEPRTLRKFQDAGIDIVETVTVLKPAEIGMGAVIDQAALESSPDAPELIVRCGSAEVELRGRSVVLSHQIFPVFQRLVEKALSRDRVASGPFLEGTTGREAKDLVREIRDQFKTVGFSDTETKSFVKSIRGRGYELGVTASDILVIE